MTIEEAKAMLTTDAMEHLKKIVIPAPVINTSNKSNNDILMQALCSAAETGVIKPPAIDDKLLKLLNSSTNTLSPSKLGSILEHVRKTQPNMRCVITVKTADMKVLKEWTFIGPECNLNVIFEFVVDEFDITPQVIRSKMTTMLKPTIVNNIAQLVAKYETLDEDDRRTIPVSITTITRLVNMSDHMLFAEFVDN